MKRIIVYGPHYGTTQTYAERLSKLTGIPAVRCNQARSLAAYGQKMDFVDFDALLPIADALRQPPEEPFLKTPLTLP